MFEKITSQARGIACKVGAVVGGTMLSAGAVMAQETSTLQTDALALIDTNKAVALAIASGITLAILALKFVKLPRRG